MERKEKKKIKHFLTVERTQVLSSFTVETKIKIQNCDVSVDSGDSYSDNAK